MKKKIKAGIQSVQNRGGIPEVSHHDPGGDGLHFGGKNSDIDLPVMYGGLATAGLRIKDL